MVELTRNIRLSLRRAALASCMTIAFSTFAEAQPATPPPAIQPPSMGETPGKSAPDRPPAISPVQPPAGQSAPSQPGSVPSQPATPGTSQQTAGACCIAKQPEDAWTARDYATLLSGLAGILAFFVGLGAIWSNIRSTRNSNNQRTNEAELKSIAEKLDRFYGPYSQLSNTNKLLADELKSRHPETPEMRLLLLMLDPGWKDKLSRGDKTHIDEIIDLDRRLLALIQDSAGMVDGALQPYLYRAAAHFRMMLRAYAGDLDNAPPRYQAYVYPRQLDSVMALEVARLKERMLLLQRRPSTLHPPMQALVIPRNLQLPQWPDRPEAPRAAAKST